MLNRNRAAKTTPSILLMDNPFIFERSTLYALPPRVKASRVKLHPRTNTASPDWLHTFHRRLYFTANASSIALITSSDSGLVPEA